MAIRKDIIQSDGVVTSYHRILFVQTTVNRQTSIAVISYISDEAREMEKESTEVQPYCRSITYETEYSESMTIEDAYNYLKTLTPFEGAEDC